MLHLNPDRIPQALNYQPRQEMVEVVNIRFQYSVGPASNTPYDERFVFVSEQLNKAIDRAEGLTLH